MAIRRYSDLDVHQESYAAALEVSKAVKSFPAFEQFELARQLRRAARSIPANIVEGWAKRQSAAEFKRYLQVAIGSCDEVKLWLEMGKDEGYMAEDAFKKLGSRYNRIGAMLASLWRNWQSGAR
ncbi:MAG: four helix bundle protein [Candidatus Acidiferrales bacterium]